MSAGEFELIEELRKLFTIPPPEGFAGFGDDCAAIGNRLVSVDMLVEGVHFIRKLTPLKLLGRKALSVNVSDIAADGGIAKEFYLSIARPADLTDDQLMELLAGAADAAADYKVALLGGDLTASPSGLVISITIIGEASSVVITRAGARPGDLIGVTGTLGDSAIGLKLLQNHDDFARAAEASPALVEAHLNPPARDKAGPALAEAGVGAMIDISDGLLGDLGHILAAGGVGAEINAAQLPLSEPYLAEAERLKLNRFELAATGGEDYELLFTYPTEAASRIAKALAGINIQFSEIGGITDRPGRLRVIDENGDELKFSAGAWDHFRSR